MTRIVSPPQAILGGTFCALLFFVFVFFDHRFTLLYESWVENESAMVNATLFVISAYFAAQNLASESVKPIKSAALLCIPIAAILVFSDALDLNAVFFAAIALLFPLMVLGTLGLKASISILSAWGIILMTMPFWTVLTPFLQALTVKAVSYWASLASLTVLVEGNFFTVTTGVVHVEGGCSGLKYFVAAITIALISASLDKRPLFYTIVSVIIASALAMLGNWIRVYILLLVAYYEGIDHHLMADHDTLGWIVFAVTLAPWLYLDRILDRRSKKKPTATDEPQILDLKSVLRSSSLIFTAILISLISLTPPSAPQSNAEFKLPSHINNIALRLNAAQDWNPDFAQPYSTNSANVIIEGKLFNIYALSYKASDEVEMATSTNHIFAPSRWKLVSDTSWVSERDPNMKLRIATAKQGTRTRVAYYWYKHGKMMANTTMSSKLQQLKGTYDNKHYAHMLAISTLCNIDCQSNTTPSEDLERFMFEFNNIYSN